MALNTALRFTAFAAMALAVGACTREEPTAAAPPPAEAPVAGTAQAEPEKIPGTDAIAATENVTAEAGTQAAAPTVAGVERKDFAGTFAAEGTSIVFNADGTYTRTVRAESAATELQGKGTWSVQADGKELLLDSDDKTEPDRRYAVLSKDELKASEGGQVLRRAAGQ